MSIKKIMPTSRSTCSELGRVHLPLSGTSRSLQIPGSPRSHRERRDLAMPRTGDASLGAPLRSAKRQSGLAELPGWWAGGQEDPGPALASSQGAPVSRHSSATGHHPAMATANSCPPAFHTLPNTHSRGFRWGHLLPDVSSTTSAHSDRFPFAPMALTIRATHIGSFFYGQNTRNKKFTMLNIIKCTVQWH